MTAIYLCDHCHQQAAAGPLADPQRRQTSLDGPDGWFGRLLQPSDGGPPVRVDACCHQHLVLVLQAAAEAISAGWPLAADQPRFVAEPAPPRPRLTGELEQDAGAVMDDLDRSDARKAEFIRRHGTQTFLDLSVAAYRQRAAQTDHRPGPPAPSHNREK